MPLFSFELPTPTNQSPEARIVNLEATLEELFKRIAWLTSKLDSKNVKRLDTNETVIKSADGTTEIVGPVLVQKDAGGTTRLKQGYDAVSGDFVFNMYDQAGNETIGLNASGEAVFKGNISTDKNATIGLNLYLGENSDLTKDIQFVDNAGGGAYIRYFGTDSVFDGRLHVVSWDEIWMTGINLITLDAPAIDISLASVTMTGSDLDMAGNDLNDVNATGDWDFSGAASITGLGTDSVIGHTHGGAVAADGGHSHSVS